MHAGRRAPAQNWEDVMTPCKQLAVALLALGTLGLRPVAAQAPKPAAPKAEKTWTGTVSEAQFKAMHQLKTGEVPPLDGQMIDLAGGRAYLSLPPKSKAPLPAVVVIQEWWGLNDNIKHWSDRLAAEGYAALAVDLYDGKVATTSDSAMAFMKKVNPDRAREILLAGHAFLAKDPRVQASRRGSVGWCFGGGMSLQLAMAAPDLNACVMYYGRPETDVEKLKTIRAPLLAIFGNKDEAFPPPLVNEFDAALTKAAVKHEILRFDADHAFANPSNPHYDEKAAAAAWAKVQPFFAAQLKPAAGAK
jgi:carboxymethylenebutenolidase